MQFLGLGILSAVEEKEQYQFGGKKVSNILATVELLDCREVDAEWITRLASEGPESDGLQVPDIWSQAVNGDLKKILMRSANILGSEIKVDAAGEIASRSRGTPRIANRLLRRVRDFAQVKGSGVIELEIAKDALGAMDVDKMGFDEMDRKLLLTIIEKYSVTCAM